MKFLFALSLALSSVSVGTGEVELLPSSFSICAGEPLFTGEYVISNGKADGVPTYSNSNEMSFFRNNGFWLVSACNLLCIISPFMQ